MKCKTYGYSPRLPRAPTGHVKWSEQRSFVDSRNDVYRRPSTRISLRSSRHRADQHCRLSRAVRFTLRRRRVSVLVICHMRTTQDMTVKYSCSKYTDTGRKGRVRTQSRLESCTGHKLVPVPIPSPQKTSSHYCQYKCQSTFNEYASLIPEHRSCFDTRVIVN